MYIAIEGIDTAGKSTQYELLKSIYTNAIFTKEPGGTPLGVKLRAMALGGEAKSKLAEMFLFLADRAEHTQEIILKNKDRLIVSDRSLISGIAYAKDFPMEMTLVLNLIATSNNIPKKVILLELSKEELIKRLSGKVNDSIESRGVEYLLDIQQRMKQTIIKLGIDFKFIDASLSIEQIHQEIKEFIDV
ncbi:dTMP kinase [Arcobacter sp. FWKO B]|uniref:dTMP kinase n=1 Tax=Arcobacter sp. FWKO B TaxID=2593672 RepID=UPI0018A57957|nr:dTMP kinase [Arcobacter sp. FWKO B]QOG13140.1 dTMP kinase [Arcobacter sp. FWKO B]